MKTLYTILFLVTGMVAFSQSEFYYYHGDSIQLVEDTSKCTVEFIGEPDETFFTQNNITYSELTGSVFEAGCNKNHILALGSGLVNALPQYTTNAGHKIRLSCSIVVRYKESTTSADIDSLILANNLSLKTDYVFFQVYETFYPLQAARSMHESGLVDFCDPNFIVENKQSSHIPDDEFFPKQWHLFNTGMQDSNDLSSTVGADINVIGGWDYSTGDPEVIIAIYNDKIVANHPDIPENKICRLSGANMSGDFEGPDTFSDNSSSHGTCVAGIVAAEMDNEIGVCGIAPSSRIMPVFGGLYALASTTCYQYYYALQNGCRILSWSGGNLDLCDSQEYGAAAAIENGLLVLRAAQNGSSHSNNHNAPILPEEYAEIPHLIIVGASDRNDEQVDYSPTNPLLDIVAPSATDFRAYNSELLPISFAPIENEERNIWSTDIPGSNGIADPSNPWAINDPSSIIEFNDALPEIGLISNPLDYTGRFYGTSAATPQVASVAALMVSANSCLTVEQIEEILFATATKIGDPLEYDALGHSDKFGYGKVNAQAAIEMALSPAYGGIDFDIEVLDRVCGPDDSGTFQINCATPSLYSAELIMGYTENTVTGLGEYIDLNSAINLISEPVNFNEPIVISNLPAHLLVRITSLTEVNPYPTHNSNNILVNPWGEKPCTSTREIWLKGPQIVATLTPVICGDPDSGEAILQIEGNNNEINSYDWTVNGDAYADVNEITLTGLSQGNLEVTITDAFGKTCTNTYPISTAEDCCENIASTILNQSQITCPNSSDGSLLLEINGTESEYTFDWTSQSTHQVIENLPQNETGIELAACGDYTLEVSDNLNLCSKTFDYTIACVEEIEAESTLTNISCYGLSDGSIALSVTGGNGGYEIDWNENIPNIFNPLNLAAGIYAGLISDQNGCTKIIEYTLNEPTEIVITSNYIVEPSCPEASDGQLEIAVTGGSGNYSFDWINEESENAIITGISEGAYEVQVTDDSGCSQSELFEVEATAFNYATNHTYDNENWNGQTILFGGDLIIPLGDWPTFSNVTFVFAQGAQLIIEEGAIVILENCTLTSCGANWDGIWVKSYGNGVGAGPGNLIMNGGLIRYATTGMFYPDLYVWDGPYESGNVNCTNVQFENNRTAIRVEKTNQADDDQNYVGPFAFRGCTFSVDDDYNNHFTQPFEQHVYMHLNTGNGFRSCSFLNNMSNGVWAERGRAIYAVESRFDIDDLDENGIDQGLSVFEGFDIAVYNHIFTAPYNGMIVRESSFNRNRIGIITRGMCFQDIVRNTVHVGDETGTASLDAEAIDREGIVIDGGGFFMLSENDVTGFQLATTEAATIGIRIRDILTGSEEVYNNTIANCNYANLANGQNSLGDEGVRYVCNYHSGSITDLLVSEFPGNDNSASIGPWQSDLGSFDFSDNSEKSAGNTFSSVPGEFHISNEGTEPINYLFGSGNDEEPTSTDGLLITQPSNDDNSCDFIVVDMLPEIGNISPTTIGNWQAGLAQTKQDWLNSKYLYTLLIDNGNTQELLDEVAYNWTSDVWLTREKIMYSSPYVSSQVLYELADQTTVGFPLAIALEIFMANPNVTNTTSFLKYLDEECNFPKYMQAILASQNNTSAIREEVEANLAKNHMRYLESSVPLIKNLWRKDSTSADSLIIALGALESLTAEFAIVDLYLRNGDMQAAEDRFAALEENIILTPEMEEEQITFGKWLDLAMDNPKWLELSNAELGGLSDLALDAYYTTAGKKAAAILNTYYGEDHFIPPYYQGAPGEVRTFMESLKMPRSIKLLEVYPNPANDYLNIKMLLDGVALTNESLTVYDALGQPLQTLKVNDANQQFVLDLRNYSAGNYTISLQASEKTLQTITFNVVH